MLECSYPGCGNKHNAHGYCSTHYRRWRLYGDASHCQVNTEHDGFCTIDGCNKPYRSRGYCHTHYRRFKKHGDPLYQSTRAKPGSPAEFIERVLEMPITESCVEWPFARNNDGYATFSGKYANGERQPGIKVHRYILKRFTNLSGDGMLACHRCNNEPCINPTHLYWGTTQQNAADRIAAGTHLRGEDSPVAKLNKMQVLSIRRDTRPVREIANEHKVSPRCIRGIIKRERWAWL